MPPALCIFTILCLLLLALLFYRKLKSVRRKNSIAIFHLYCSSGGGGERVLWHAIEALVHKYPKYTIYIYSQRNIGNNTLEILVKVRELFRIDLLSDRSIIEKLEFVPLSLSPLVEAKYPFLTLLFQNVASIIVAIQAAYHVVPDIYMETIGFTFTLPIFKLLRCSVITYVHYPTISNDMIHNVKTSSHASFNNREIFVRIPVLRHIKLIYYRILASTYGYAGRCADLVMVNSSWTRKHIDSLWRIKSHVVYPPCDVDSFKELQDPNSPLGQYENRSKNLNIISIAQFRPEKNHLQQIEAFDTFLRKSKNYESTLTLFGGCRDSGDKKRVEELHHTISMFELESNVEIVVGASFDRLLAGMSKANVAIHTMKNEHFGIVLLECMAAGLITIAHKSGGPKEDIIDHGINGFLADSVEDFAETLLQVSNMSFDQRQVIRRNATNKADQFSDQVFKDNFIKLISRFL